MIKSMTGYGKAEATSKYGTAKVELRSINHRYLDISVKLPEALVEFEDKIRAIAQQDIRRGKVYINILFNGKDKYLEKIIVDETLASAYYKQLLTLKKRLHLNSVIRLEQLLSLPGVVRLETRDVDVDKFWPTVKRAVEKSLKVLKHSRLKEGRMIQKDIWCRVRVIKKALEVIKNRSADNVEVYRERLAKMVKELSGNELHLDKNRLEQEVVIFAKNSDVTEEIVRMKSHLACLEDTLSSDDEIGKKLDFVAQELFREVNTIGTKSGDYIISQKVILIKTQIEKLREQAKNVE